MKLVTMTESQMALANMKTTKLLKSNMMCSIMIAFEPLITEKVPY